MVLPRVNLDRVILPSLSESEKIVDNEHVPAATASIETVPTAVATPSSKEMQHVPTQSPLRESTPERLTVAGPAVNGGSHSIEAELVPAVAALKVYEDPVDASPINAASESPLRPSVLEERTINEPIRLGNIPSSPTPFGSPKKSPLKSLKKKLAPEPSVDAGHSRDVITTNISQIRAGRIDAGGFQELQTAIESNRAILSDGTLYDEILSGLLDYLQLPDEKLPNGGVNGTHNQEPHVSKSSNVPTAFNLITTSLQHRSAQPSMTTETTTRLGLTLVRYLSDLDPAIRQAVTRACVALYDQLEPHSRFWQVVNGVQQEQRALLCCYLARFAEADLTTVTGAA